MRSSSRGRSRMRVTTTAAALALIFALTDMRGAPAAQIKMVFPGPATTFGLPLYVAQKKGWLGDLTVEEIIVTGDSNAMQIGRAHV